MHSSTWAYPFPLFRRATPFDLPFISLYLLIACGLTYLLFARIGTAQRERELLSREMEAARALQKLLVPECPPTFPGFAVQDVYLPAQAVGGDFFELYPATDGSLLLVLGDVSGKGVRAAMLVSLIVGALRQIVAETRQPSVILQRLNEGVLGQTGEGFITCLCARWDADGQFTLANAGHLPPYRGLAGRWQEMVLTQNGFPLGVVGGVEYPELHDTAQSGERFLFYSDGIVEERSKKGKLFGFDGLATLLAHADLEQHLPEQILQAVQRYNQGDTQDDDISIVMIQRQ